MNSITKEYLATIIIGKIAEDISIHRKFRQQPCEDYSCPVPTDEEVLDFIITIPYFDDKLKDFLIGNLKETTVITSQAWENEFIRKTNCWAKSLEWLHGEDPDVTRLHRENAQSHFSFLSLPY